MKTIFWIVVWSILANWALDYTTPTITIVAPLPGEGYTHEPYFLVPDNSDPLAPMGLSSCPEEATSGSRWFNYEFANAACHQI